MAKTQAAAPPTADVEQAAAEQIKVEMDRLLFDAPITELAQSQGISVDEAASLRVEKCLEAAPMQMDVTVRPIEPQGKLIGFASVNFGNGIVVDDFKVVDGKSGKGGRTG